MDNLCNLFNSPLDDLKSDEIIRLNREYEKKCHIENPLRILILANITIDPITPYIKYLGYQTNLPPEIYIGSYDNIFQEIVLPQGLFQKTNPDFIIIIIKMENFNEKFANTFSSMQPAGIDSAKADLIGFIRKIIEEIRKNSNAIILVHNFEVPVYPSSGIMDYQKNNGEVNTLREINKNLIELLSGYKGTYVIDIENLRSIIGYENFIDNRNWYLSKLPYSQKALRLISREYIKFLKPLRGKIKKCIVLDCDNTLWGGIIGEEGINNIQLGNTFPGSTYVDFQKSILNLYNRGIMLAICSKNNENDVMEVFEKHPNMVLKKDHFVSMKINWTDKATNIKEIARDLNIGLDSIVFIDDNQFELNQVKQILPDIDVIPVVNPVGCMYKDIIYRTGFFETLSLSEEDRIRNELYKADSKRELLKSKTKTLEDFFINLEMEVYIQNVDDFSIPRIAQLTQKTNQFNLTTKRYTEADISSLSKSKEWSVRYLELKDKFGNNGIVGVAILHFLPNVAAIDTFLLSCRVIGRTVETVFLMDCIELAKKRGYNEIIGSYIPTKKNIQVESFYPEQGFEKNGNEGEETFYRMGIRDFPLKYPDHFKIIKRV